MSCRVSRDAEPVGQLGNQFLLEIKLDSDFVKWPGDIAFTFALVMVECPGMNSGKNFLITSMSLCEIPQHPMRAHEKGLEKISRILALMEASINFGLYIRRRRSSMWILYTLSILATSVR